MGWGGEAKSNKACQFLSEDKNIKSLSFQRRGPFSFLTAFRRLPNSTREAKEMFSVQDVCAREINLLAIRGCDKSLSHYVEGSSTLMLQRALTRAHNEVST